MQMKVNEYQKSALLSLKKLMAQGQGLDKEYFEDIFQANSDKLKKKYPDGFEKNL